MEAIPTQKLDCKDLHGYVLTLPPSVLDQLYGHPATCLAIFRFVMSLHRMLVLCEFWLAAYIPTKSTTLVLNAESGAPPTLRE